MKRSSRITKLCKTLQLWAAVPVAVGLHQLSSKLNFLGFGCLRCLPPTEIPFLVSLDQTWTIQDMLKLYWDADQDIGTGTFISKDLPMRERHGHKNTGELQKMANVAIKAIEANESSTSAPWTSRRVWVPCHSSPAIWSQRVWVFRSSWWIWSCLRLLCRCQSFPRTSP